MIHKLQPPLLPLALRRLPGLIAVFACLCGAASLSYAGTLTHPNIIYIMLDDAGYGDTGAYGTGSFVQTPEADQLATDGLLFTQHYANAPVCSPSRAAILTGKYQQEFGIRRVIPPESTRGLPAGGLTLPKLLAPEGYVSGMFGKWHLGDLQPQNLPNAQGFEESAIYLRDGDISYFDPTFIESFNSPGTTQVPKTGHMTEIITDYALDFIDDHASESYLLCVWYLAPHFPYEPPNGWQAKWPYAATSNGRYAALLSNADEQIGRIVDRLDALGMTNTTLVVYTSDNGSPQADMYSNGDSKGTKTDLFEGGIRAPLIVRWPGTIPANTTTDAVSVGFDFFPSIASALGIDTSGMGLDGEDLSTVLGGGPSSGRQALLFWDTKDSTTRAYPINEEFNRWAVRDGDWKVVQQDNEINGSPFLFDLDNDPQELIDLSALYPEIVGRLEREYRLWRFTEGEFDFQIDSTLPGVSIAGDTYTFSGGRVTLADDSRFNIDDADFSFYVKVTPTALTGQKIQYIGQKLDSWRLFIRRTGEVRLNVQGPGLATQMSITSASPLLENVEYEIMFSIYGWRNSNSLIRLYVNGQLQGQDESLLSVNAATSAVQLGSNELADAPFTGVLSEPTYYSMALSQNEGRDTDGDGYRNSTDNCSNGVNPLQNDFDQDGAGDFCDPDDDNDGLLDIVETDTGTYVSSSDTGSSPLNADTDGDGSLDGAEVLLGYDPTDWDSRTPTYTRRSDFDSRLFGRSGLTDFDSFAAGALLSNTTILVSGAEASDVDVPIVDDVIGTPGAQLSLIAVEDTGANPTTSSFQSVGANDPGNYNTIMSGTEIQFSFPEPTQGFGLSVITPDQRHKAILNRDIHLEVPGIGTAMLEIDDAQYVTTSGGIDYYAYFLGVFGSGTDTFASATVRYDAAVPDGSFLFNIDDMISVPEPSRAALLLIGSLGLTWVGRRGPFLTPDSRAT